MSFRIYKFGELGEVSFGMLAFHTTVVVNSSSNQNEHISAPSNLEFSVKSYGDF